MQYVGIFIIFAAYCTGDLHANKWHVPIGEPPEVVKIYVDSSGERNVIVGTEKGLYFFNKDGNRLHFLPFAPGVRTLSVIGDHIFVGSGSNLYMLTPDFRVLKRRRLQDFAVRSCEDGDRIFILTERRIYGATTDLAITWSRKIPAQPETLACRNGFLGVKGRDWLYALTYEGDSLYLYKVDFDLGDNRLKWFRMLFLKPLGVGDHCVAAAFPEGDSSLVLVSIDPENGRILFKKELSYFPISVTVFKDHIYLSGFRSMDRSLKKEGYDAIFKYSRFGELRGKIRTPYLPLLLRGGGDLLFAYFTTNDYSIFHGDLNEVWVSNIDIGVRWFYFLDVPGQPYPDIVMAIPPTGTRFYNISYARCCIPHYIAMADSFYASAMEERDVERAMMLLSSARSLYYLYEPWRVREVENRMRYLGRVMMFRRRLRGLVEVLLYAVMIFVVMLVMSYGLREVVWRLRGVDYEAMRVVESGFLHDMRKKVRLMRGVLRMERDGGVDVGRYVGEDIREMERLLWESEWVLRRLPRGRFRLGRMRGLVRRLGRVGLVEVEGILGEIEEELGRLSGDLGRWRGYIVEAVRMGLERFRRGYDLRGVELEEDVDWGERGRELYRDHVMRYGEVIYNLLVNAYEALGGRGGRIRFYYGRDEGGGVVLEVEDNGVGMSEEELGRMWRRGYSGKEGGTGMGLTEEVREFLERYGRVEVESEEGVGTVVRVYVR